jgi:hypothetical protein
MLVKMVVNLACCELRLQATSYFSEASRDKMPQLESPVRTNSDYLLHQLH